MKRDLIVRNLANLSKDSEKGASSRENTLAEILVNILVVKYLQELNFKSKPNVWAYFSVTVLTSLCT